MIKLFLSVLLVALCSAFGWILTRRYKQRKDFFYALDLFNARFINEVSYTKLPLAAFFDKYPFSGDFGKLLEEKKNSGFVSDTFDVPYLTQDEKNFVRDYFMMIGRSDSASQKDYLQSARTETERLVNAGFKEIVLIGIHLGCYGKENPGGATLYDAVKTVLAVPGVQRVRLGSLESVEVEPRLLELMREDSRFCRHLHLPLQSGCDKVLQAMHRPYTTAKFKTLLADIKTRVPDIAITTDVIVGFPGETEADFETTCKFAESCGFSKMHIFPFSARKGTPAEKFEGAVTEAVKKDRADALGKIDEAMHRSFLQGMVGQTAEVLFEQPAGEYFEGLTGNYQRVFVKSEGKNLGGEILPVKITAFDGEKLLGELIK